MFKEFYRNKRVLVTGDTGFKGSWLCIWLKELGAEITGYSLEPPSHPNNFEGCSLATKIEHIHGDIRDERRLLEVFREKRPQIVLHLAAQALVKRSYNEPRKTFEINAGGTVHLMEAVRSTPDVRVVINVTSDKCYENRGWSRGYCESDPLGGYDPYSASKACSEIVFSSYLKSFLAAKSVGAASVRAGNVLGGGDWGKDRLVPDCIRAWISGEAVQIRMPEAIRPWQFVLEPLSGYLQLGALLWEAPEKYSGPWNFGPSLSEGIAVREVLKRVSRLWGRGKWVENVSPGDPHEASTLNLCCDKAEQELGWSCILGIDESLALTLGWYKEFYDRQPHPDPYGLCCRQIRHYSEKARTASVPWAG